MRILILAALLLAYTVMATDAKMAPGEWNEGYSPVKGVQAMRADEPGHDKQKRRHERPTPWSRSLTPEQRKTVSALCSEFGEAIAPLSAKINRAANDLYWSLNEEQPDREAVMAATRTVAAARGEMLTVFMDYRLRWIESGLPAEAFRFALMESRMMLGRMFGPMPVPSFMGPGGPNPGDHGPEGADAPRPMPPHGDMHALMD